MPVQDWAMPTDRKEELASKRVYSEARLTEPTKVVSQTEPKHSLLDKGLASSCGRFKENVSAIVRFPIG